MRILIVDDSRTMRLIIMRTLRQSGFGNHTLEEAADGAAALNAIRTAPPDLVLSDWNMPAMSGLELLQKLRAEGCHVHFGFVTSEGTEEMRRLALDSGALFLVTKPFTAEAFKDALDKVPV